MILLDGKKLSQKILEDLKHEIAGKKKKLRLAIIVIGEDPVIKKFIAQKKKTAESVDIDIRIYPFEESITTNELRKRIAEIVHEEKNSGVIVQLPLPAHINTQYILSAVTPEKDVDVLSARALGNVVVGKSPVISPVAGAVKAFFEEYAIEYKDKHILVAGFGNLVGRPIAIWLFGEHATFSVINKDSPNPEKLFREADIIITGVGKPKFITGDMVKEGVVIMDAGTSESEGGLVGDVDFDSVGPKSSFITPVPGGIGPLTVAFLLKNLVTLSKEQ